MDADPFSDNHLMLQVEKGKLDHLGLLFERYHRLLFGFFYRMNQNAPISEDLVQNVFERILKYKHRFRGDGEFKAWMFQIARNVHSDHFRKKGNAPKEALEDWQEDMIDASPRQDAMIMKKEEIDQLRKALQKLDPEKREILVLSKLQGLKYKKIAEMLDCTEGAVKVKVFRALKALREVMMKG